MATKKGSRRRTARGRVGAVTRNAIKNTPKQGGLQQASITQLHGMLEAASGNAADSHHASAILEELKRRRDAKNATREKTRTKHRKPRRGDTVPGRNFA
jgi:hypothetical protein